MSSSQSAFDADCTTAAQEPQAGGCQPWLQLVAEKAAKIRYGSLHISVHNGEVTAVECVEKTRFNQPGAQAAQAGR